MQNNICQILHHDFPNSFPYGYGGAGVTELAHKIFYNNPMNTYTHLQCAECQFINDATEDRQLPVLAGFPHISNTTRDLLKTTLVSQSRLVCPECISPLTSITKYTHNILLFSITQVHISINKSIKIRTCSLTYFIW